ncbi:MAG: hypothetical protein KGJ93_01365 [Patescibacteria group bacterium]|nr:hypothetical protein [Patescibacteria group bacterium]
MTWQDIVLSVGSWIFIAALVPSLLSKDKPPIATSLSTGSVLLVYTVVYVSLHLWLSTASTGILALAWLALGAQKYRAKNHAEAV